ncbi:protein ABHD11-like [Ruditapes philippinarum]|uniref:protein ABHD11-like n=1 Tax=Ruditapes philippinarum TaxID=129788 RepID=UPI00295AC7C2|nr:protein ABHD11-like [Ruditapes philippinarum]
MFFRALLKRHQLIQCCARCLESRKMSSNSNAVNLSYYSYEKKVDGALELQPIIILHGMMGSKQNWQSLAKVFGKSGRKVLAVDARNHGESTHTEEMNYFLFRDDVLRLMDQQELEQVVLIGHSMGGKTAMTTALTNPERVSGLVVVDVSPAMSPNVNKTPAYLEAMLRISLSFIDANTEDSNPAMSQVRRQVLDDLAVAVQDEAMRHFLASNLTIRDNKLTWKCNLDAIINNHKELASFPEFEDEQYYGRCLFVGGSESDYIREKHYPVIKSLFPLAEIQHIPGAGHWVHSEKPRQFIHVVNKFLSDSGL